jgi:alkylation response protein AidB-like acyl-CoA dehydrogenase
MLTTAKLSPDGSHYIVNGIKKWITGGTAADIFVTAVRTGGPGHNGLSFLIIERSEGVSTSKIKTSYSGAASTALVMFENVKVPRENLIGRENTAFKMIMANFNHERWMIVHGWVGKMRNIVADCYRWAMQRKAFGKRLIDQPVIRYKLAEMSEGIESIEAWTDSITYQMSNMEYSRQAMELAAPIALLKFHTTRTCVMMADNAAQIFGGRAVTKTGMGKNIEEFIRAYKIVSIYGGSEEVLADMAVRQSVGMLEAKIAKGDKKAIVMARL